MTSRRPSVWTSSSRVLNEKWQEEQLQSHRARLQSIHTLPSHSLSFYGSNTQSNGQQTKSFQVVPRAQSPAAKSRQAEIERENVKLIKKILQVQTNKGARIPQQPTSISVGDGQGRRRTRRPSSAYVRTSDASDPSQVAYEEDVRLPRGASHVLYTRSAAPMDASTIGSTFSARKRTQVQIHQENKQLLRRILSSRASFSRSKWQQDEEERRKLLSNISRFSHRKTAASPPSTRSTQLSMTDECVLGMSATIRTGSPVTHLSRRPMSAASAAVRSPRFKGHSIVPRLAVPVKQYNGYLSETDAMAVVDAMAELEVGENERA